jgi:hypothetical protein
VVHRPRIRIEVAQATINSRGNKANILAFIHTVGLADNPNNILLIQTLGGLLLQAHHIPRMHARRHLDQHRP